MTSTLRDASDAQLAAIGPGADNRPNNFDLIRLLAAAQVAVVHAGEHLGALPPKVIMWLGLFRGVPIFFFVSGFLISQAVDRTTDYKQYAKNRILRVFPAPSVRVVAARISN